MASLPQPAIFAMGSRSHFTIELDLLPGADPARILEVIGSLEGTRSTTGGANVVFALRPAVWRAAGGELPSDIDDLPTITGPDGFTIPAEQHDVWCWVSGPGYDLVFDVARTVALAFAPIATVATQRAGFTYRDSRDLSGFEDGTENPPLDEAPFLASVPDGEPGAGGSVVLFQRWVHDLPALHALDVGEQERVIGRTKDTSEELDDDAKPPTAHISRVVIEEDGEELEIFRRSVPYGDLAEHGLLFIAFSQDQDRLLTMLRRMAGVEDGIRDALTTWSTPAAGALYFAPPLDRARGVRQLIEAAGGVVWRRTAGGGVEVLLAHRDRYDDWSLPKGKLDPGEDHLTAAVREVLEETGLVCAAGDELPSTTYEDRYGRPKRVRYWAMTVVDGSFERNDEVDEVRWVPLEQVPALVSYPRDAEVVAGLSPPDDELTVDQG